MDNSRSTAVNLRRLFAVAEDKQSIHERIRNTAISIEPFGFDDTRFKFSDGSELIWRPIVDAYDL